MPTRTDQSRRLVLDHRPTGMADDTIVVVMTGNPSVTSSIEALRAGAWDYLPKPFSATHLQVLIGPDLVPRLADALAATLT